jgi:hypothetical protein
MRRSLGICANLVLLTLCGIIALLWLRTPWFDDQLYFHAVTHDRRCLWQLYITSRTDRITLELFKRRAVGRDVDWLSEQRRVLCSWSVNKTEGGSTWRPQSVWHGFVFDRGFWWARPPDGYHLSVPHWLPLVLVGVIPSLMATRSYRTYRRRVRGLCPACGYDLRATPGRCPECGTDASQSLASAPAGREAEPAPPARAV